MGKSDANLIERVTKLSVQTALEFLEKEKKRQLKEQHDRRLRNIKLLLRNYRAFVKHCEDVKADINDLQEQLDLSDIDTDDFKIMSILRSKERTLAMVSYINKALKVYKIMCEESEDVEAKRRYQVIYEMYISEEKITAKDLATGHFVHTRTIYKDVDNACKTLAVLMFGIDGIKFR